VKESLTSAAERPYPCLKVKTPVNKSVDHRTEAKGARGSERRCLLLAVRRSLQQSEVAIKCSNRRAGGRPAFNFGAKGVER
jgi:hypothetical protein